MACWGEYYSSALGGRVGSSVPVTVEGISPATAVVVGGDHRCALLSDRRVVCWGDNFGGRLGDGTTQASRTPVTVKF